MAKEIPLTQGKVAIVDDEDFERLNAFSWYARSDARLWYAERITPRVNGRRTYPRMHREIMGVTDPKIFIDHANGDGLDNRKENLRLCDNRRNQHNLHNTKRGKSSKYKGVCWHKKGKKWSAQIRTAERLEHLGLFASEDDAARAYNAAALKYFGEFACINKIGLAKSLAKMA